LDKRGYSYNPETVVPRPEGFLIWITSRIWPGRYPLLEKALLNYKAVLQDFLNVFDKHIDTDNSDNDLLRTCKFYQIDEFNEKLYESLLKKYEAHECLVCDLFFELTRAANYVCDRVRENIFSGYRMKEGVLLVRRDCVGYEMKTTHARAEYRDEERTEMPYPGLERFEEIRYTRDYALDPNEPEPPVAS
jgi:hypothetical protein